MKLDLKVCHFPLQSSQVQFKVLFVEVIFVDVHSFVISFHSLCCPVWSQAQIYFRGLDPIRSSSLIRIRCDFLPVTSGCDWHLVGSLRLVDTRVELVNFTALSLQLAPTGSNSCKLAPTRSNSPKLVHSFLLLFLFFYSLFLRWLNSIFVWFEDRVEPAQLNLHTDFTMTFPNSKVIGSCGRAGSSEGMAANQDCTIFWYKKSMLRLEMAKFSYNFTQL